MDVREIVYAKENEFRPNRFETAFAVDQQGKIILEKRGEDAEIAFTDEEIAIMQTASGVIFTHNHPGGWKYTPDDPRHAGNSFSPHDIHLACKAELAEIRVVTPLCRFSMLPPEVGWNEAYWHETLWPVYQRVDERVKEELISDALFGRIRPLDASVRRYHEVWVRVANLLGLRYTRIEE